MKQEKCPLVSVVIAVYNAERFLQQALDSLISQRLCDFEIICVDDYSTDKSLQILSKYAKIDSRIKVIKNDVMADGAGAARNLGISLAKGKYLSVLDADDFFEPSLLYDVVHKAISSDADVVMYDGYEFDSVSKSESYSSLILRKQWLPAHKDIFSAKDCGPGFFLSSIGAAWHMLFSLKFIKEKKIFFQSFHHADDLGFVYTALSTANRITVLNERLIHYRRNNPDSQARNITMCPESCYLSLIQLKKELIRRGVFDKVKTAFVNKVLDYINFYLENIKENKSYIKLYKEIKENYIVSLGIITINSGFLMQHKYRLLRHCLINMTAQEYCFHRLSYYNDYIVSRLSKPIKNYSKIVIYGAGEYGRIIFNYFFSKKNVKIISWVDQRYQELGFPVFNPEVINDNNFDYIIITVLDKKARNSIYRYIQKLGITREKIIYIFF